MRKKLSITVDEQVYAALHQVIGRHKISRFIESNRLGVSITVQEVEKELPKLISGERPILVDTNFDTGPVILDHLSKHLVALMEA